MPLVEILGKALRTYTLFQGAYSSAERLVGGVVAWCGGYELRLSSLTLWF